MTETDTETSTRVSPALQFLTTARDSMPAGVGDRLYSATMGGFMSAAITCGMVFDRNDAGALKRLNFHTCVGVFRALDEHYYTLACKTGGTYPALWEKAHGIKPWKAACRLDDHKAGRVASDMAFLIKAEDTEGENLDRVREFQVWWVTSMERDRILIGRYKSTHVTQRQGSPVRRKTLTRDAWDELQKTAI